MDTRNEAAPSSAVFEDSSRVAIADLNPNRELLPDSHIDANVILVWPYSSSSQQLSLLLAERDVRLRRSKGQLKVTFHGECARAVAKLQGGVGDSVKLGLQDVTWSKTDEAVSTPGKKLGWDVELYRTVRLEIRRDVGKAQVLDIKIKPSPQSSQTTSSLVSASNTAGYTNHVPEQVSVQTPAFKTPKRILSGSYADPTLSPFTDNEAFISGRASKRTKFARPSGSWRVLGDDDDSGSDVAERLETDRQLDGPLMPVVIRNGVPDDQQSEKNSARLSPVGPGQTILEATDNAPAPAMSDTISKISDDDGSVIDLIQDGQQHSMAPPPLPPPIPPSLSEIPGNEATVMDPTSGSSMVPLSTPTIQPVVSPQLQLISPPIQSPSMVETYFPISHPDIETPEAPESEHEHDSQEFLAPHSVDRPDFYAQQILSLTDELEDVQDSSAPPSVTSQRSIGSPVADADKIQPTYLLEPTLTTQSDNATRVKDVTEAAYTPDFVDTHQASSATFSPLLPQIPDYVGVTAAENALAASFIDLDALEDAIQQDADGFRSDAVQADSIESQDMYGPPEDIGSSFPAHSPSRFMDPIQAEWTLVEPIESSVSLVESDPDIQIGEDEQTNSNPASPTESLVQYDGSSDGRQEQADRIHAQAQSSLDNSANPIKLAHLHSHEEGLDQSTNDNEPGIEVLMDLAAGKVIAAGEEESVSSLPSPAELNSQLGDVALDQSQPAKETIDSASAAEVQSTQLQLPTPAATQDLPKFQHQTAPFESDRGISPPTSPVKTRPKRFSIIETTGLQEHPGERHEANPGGLQLPEAPVSGNQGATKRTSSRLTRKLLSSDTVENEYFTPRRSSRVLRAHDTSFVDNVLQEDTLDSPTEIRQDQHISPKNRAETKLLTDALTQQLPIVSRSPPLHRGLTTPLSYYPQLSMHHEFYGQAIDIVALCTTPSTEPRKAKSGPRDYHTTLHLVDMSTDGHGTTTAQFFRPKKAALPVAGRGDVVILRDMKVQSAAGKTMLLSTEASSWAVFGALLDDRLSISINGPPVEYGDAEIGLVTRLIAWWTKEADTSRFVLHDQEEVQNATIDPPTSPTSRRPRISKPDVPVITTIQELPQHGEARITQSAEAPTSTSMMFTRSQRRKNAQELAETEPFTVPVETGSIAERVESSIGRGAEEELPPSHAESVNIDMLSASGKDPIAVNAPASVSTVSPRRPRRRRKRRRDPEPKSEEVSGELIHELRDGTTYTDIPGNSVVDHDQGFETEDGAGIVIHELRDGHRYVDT